MMAVWGLHLDFPPDAAGGALFPYLESMACQSFGMVIGQGGADTMITALTGHLQALGGKIHLDTPVAEIRRTGNRATGIRLVSGETVEASRAVIANVHPRLLFDNLARGDDHAAYRASLAGFKPGPATMMIHYALDRLPDWAAGAALKSFAYVHLAPDFATMSRAYDEAKAGLLPGAPALVVGQPTALDPTRAPEGRHVLWVQVRVLPSVIAGDAAGVIAGRDWHAVKDPYADRIDTLIERYAPGFKGRVLGRAVLSPRDLEADNPNLVGGDSLSGSHHLDQNFLFRPVFGWSRYKTPIDRLYCIGASTWPGGGVGAGSGFMLAKMLAGA
jgi:phytoene dehydrogenase-like protein